MTLTSEKLNHVASPSRAGPSRKRTALVLAILLPGMLYASVRTQNFGEWSQAVSVDPERLTGVNTSVNDGCPIEAPDGHTLFFASNRSGGQGMNDTWVASRERKSAAWGDPVNLPWPVNSTANDFCPTPLPGNRLLFVSSRSNVCGGMNNPDIYYTRHHPAHGWLPPQHLGCEVNSPFEEFSPSLLEAKGATMLFFSSNRGDGFNHKIYVSLRQLGACRIGRRAEHAGCVRREAKRPERRAGNRVRLDS
jgi:WD40 repeat protein